MKRSEIMALEGMDLIAKIAKAQGLPVCNSNSEVPNPPVYPMCVKNYHWGELFCTKSTGELYRYNPGRNIAQAMELVQELWDGRHLRQANGRDPVASCVEILLTDNIPPEVEITVYSPTLAEVFVGGTDLCTTICHAYLMVVIGEEDSDSDLVQRIAQKCAMIIKVQEDPLAISLVLDPQQEADWEEALSRGLKTQVYQEVDRLLKDL